MIKLCVANIKIIFGVLIIYLVCQEISDKVLWRIKWRLKDSKILNNMIVNNVLKCIVSYSVISYLVSLQEMYNFINLNIKNDNSTLIIGILTVYGIFYTFVQFSISYALQNGKDKYWGRSKTKSLFEQYIEFEFFKSLIFKVLLIMAVTIPLLNIEKIKYINSYKNFIIALWGVSVFSVYLLYILLFVRSLFIMEILFIMQEGRDNYLKGIIKKKIIEEYKSFFENRQSYKNNGFIEVLFEEVRNLDKREEKEMLFEVLNNFMDHYEKIQYNQMHGIKAGKRRKRKDRDEFLYMKNFLYSIFEEIWHNIEEQKIESNFNEMLKIYKKQDRLIFNQIKIYCLVNKNSEIIKEILATYNYNSLSYFNSVTYFQVPKIIWNNIAKYKEIVEINDYFRKRVITKELFERFVENDKLTDDENRLIIEYKTYLRRVLKKGNEICNQLGKYDLINMLGKYELNKDRRTISQNIQNEICDYIISLEYNNSNKEYIKFLLKELDYKYTIIVILYMMLYTGGGDYLKWQKDIFFLKDISKHNWEYEKINAQNNMDFICKFIEKSPIGHKIEVDLILWIIKNINSKITESIIKQCNERLTYAKFLKLKYIFFEKTNYYTEFSFDNINSDNLKQDKWDDWRVDFLTEMLRTPSILKNEFFDIHQFKFFEKFLYNSIPQCIYETEDFRMFYINIYYEMNKEEFYRIIKMQGVIRKGIYEFLILNINNKNYNYLFSNNKSSKFFLSQVKNILDGSNISIEDYINDLVNKATECSSRKISINEKERIIFKLRSLNFNF